MVSLKDQKQSKMSYENIVKYIFENGVLKSVKRSGWWLIGIKGGESVSEHIQRTTLIGYILAKLENANTEKVMIMCIFHDNHESRINDLHKVGHRYINFRKAEELVKDEQLEILPKEISKEVNELISQIKGDKSNEGIVARDADLLENAFTAKEYITNGYKDAQNWINNIKKALRTESAKKILEEIEKINPNSWWYNLKKAER